jgi:alpha-galactosidase
MKCSVRYLLLLLSLPVFAGLSYLPGKGGAQPMPENSPYVRNLTMTSKFLAADFVPDGNLSKKVWKEAPHVMIDHDRFGKTPLPDFAFQVASLWTPNYVYFAYHCKYGTLNTYSGEDPAKEKWGLWDRDVVEVFINPHPENWGHYFEFEIAPNNQWIDLAIDFNKQPMDADASWNSNFDHAAKIDEAHKVWVVEFRIPVKSMNAGPIHAGDEWRLNLYRCDGPGNDDHRRFMSWSSLPDGNNGSFHQPASFGIIKFVK